MRHIGQLPEYPEPTQIHYFTNGEVLHGDHPKASAREFIAQELERKKDHAAAFSGYVATVANLNDNFASELSVLHRQLSTDFGEAADNTPIVVLGPDEFNHALEKCGVQPSESTHAYSIYGHALLQNDAKNKKFGSNYTVGLGLHEGAHAVRKTALTVVTRQSHAHDSGTEVSVNETGGLNIAGSQFWEESFADLYRVRRSGELGITTALAGAYPIIQENGDKVYFTNTELGRPNVDYEEGHFNVPSRFLNGAVITGDQVEFVISLPCYGAYGLHLLSKQIDDLFPTMLKTRLDPNAHEQVKTKINDRYPGLFQSIENNSYGPEAFLCGLVSIVEELNIANKPIEY